MLFRLDSRPERRRSFGTSGALGSTLYITRKACYGVSKLNAQKTQPCQCEAPHVYSIGYSRKAEKDFGSIVVTGLTHK